MVRCGGTRRLASCNDRIQLERAGPSGAGHRSGRKGNSRLRIMVTTTSTASGEKKDVYDITNVFNAPLNNIEGLIQSDDDAWSVLAVLNALLASLRFLTGAGKEVSLITCCICQNLAALPTLAAENNKNNKVFPWMLVSNVSRTVHYGVITRLAMVNTSALGGAKKEEVPAEPRPLPIIQEQN